jgi:uncharacterized CHY-type Zn-finger protein
LNTAANSLYLHQNRMRFFLCMLLLWAAISLESVAQQSAKKADFSISNGFRIFGKPVDTQTRCVHWHSELDIIAIKFKCCGHYYPCFNCHEETADHEAQVWPVNEFDQKAVLCGVCGHELAIKDYMTCNNICPKCTSLFNPGCSKHYHLYFDMK